VYQRLKLGYALKYTMCIKDLDKLEYVWWFHFRLKPIFATDPAALTSKVVKSDLPKKSYVAKVMTCFETTK